MNSTTRDNTPTVTAGSTGQWSDNLDRLPTTGFTELRTLRMTCMVGQHEYHQGSFAVDLERLLFCAKCGEVIKFEIEPEEDAQ